MIPFCARAQSGHAAATPPSSEMNSRRLLRNSIPKTPVESIHGSGCAAPMATHSSTSSASESRLSEILTPSLRHAGRGVTVAPFTWAERSLKALTGDTLTEATSNPHLRVVCFWGNRSSSWRCAQNKRTSGRRRGRARADPPPPFYGKQGACGRCGPPVMRPNCRLGLSRPKDMIGRQLEQGGPQGLRAPRLQGLGAQSVRA